MGGGENRFRFVRPAFTRNPRPLFAMNKLSLLLVFSVACLVRARVLDIAPYPPLTVARLQAAQRAWCDALLAISRTHRAGGDARALAASIIDRAYNYGHAPVLFKPTLAHGENTFRTTRDGALSYFVGGDASRPEDAGFALKPWVKARFRNAATFIEGRLGITMGHVTFTDETGAETTVEKTWVFRQGPDGRLRIVLHKSSLPYAPTAAVA